MDTLVPAVNSSSQLTDPVISSAVPRQLAPRLHWVSDAARLNGLHLMGEAGSGKSRLQGRIIAWLDFVRRTPLVILDPTGGVIDNFLDKISRLPREYQERLWPRVTYVEMSGRGEYTVPFPIYYRLSADDTLFDISQRYVEVVERLDPYLKTASVQGLNAIINLGTYSGMVLAALGCQITEAEDLIHHPERWEPRFGEALARYPEVEPAVDFFQEFMSLKPELRARRSDSFLTKLQPFTVDPKMKAMFGAAQAGIDWTRVVEQGQAVLLDFRHELNATRKRFKLLWCFRSLVDYLKYRGVAGRRQPISFVIDEVTQLLGFGAAEHSAMAEDIEELVSVVARNYGVYLCIAHQNLTQVHPRIQNALMAMGTQIIGVQSDPGVSRYLATKFIHYDPYWLKERERVWVTVMDIPSVIDERNIYMSPEEQDRLGSYRFMDLRRFEFLVRSAQGEGDVQTQLKKMSIAGLDSGLYPNQRLVLEARELLMQRRGRKVSDVLDEIASRLQFQEVMALKSESHVQGRRVKKRVTYDEPEELVFGEKATAAQARSRRS